MSRSPAARRRALEAVHDDIRAFTLPGFQGAPVHGPPVLSRVFLFGQAPGPHEARLGRPFAYTAGKTLFRWLERAVGATEEEVRARIYIAAVVRCFPGKTKGGGDRLPAPDEIAACRPFIAREVEILRPRLVIPVGRLAIREVLGEEQPLAEVVGTARRVQFHGRWMDAIPLPHPSGASTWFKLEPGRTLLERALALLAAHPAMQRAFSRSPPPRASSPAPALAAPRPSAEPASRRGSRASTRARTRGGAPRAESASTCARSPAPTGRRRSARGSR